MVLVFWHMANSLIDWIQLMARVVYGLKVNPYRQPKLMVWLVSLVFLVLDSELRSTSLNLCTYVWVQAAQGNGVSSLFGFGLLIKKHMVTLCVYVWIAGLNAYHLARRNKNQLPEGWKSTISKLSASQSEDLQVKRMQKKELLRKSRTCATNYIALFISGCCGHPQK